MAAKLQKDLVLTGRHLALVCDHVISLLALLCLCCELCLFHGIVQKVKCDTHDWHRVEALSKY